MNNTVTDATVEAVRKMRGEGMSFREVGDALGISRGAVAGICHRHTIMGPSPSVAQVRRYALRPDVAPKIKHEEKKVSTVKAVNPKKPALTTNKYVPIPGTTPIKLLDAKIGSGCRWVVGFHEFCGQPGYPYCKTHAAHVYTRSERNEHKAS